VYQEFGTAILNEQMAYAVLIGSTPETQIAEFQANTRNLLEVSKIVRSSHVLATWVTITPLNHVLREAIDGGQLLRADLWHPFRPPVFHSTTAVQRLHLELLDALDRAVRENGPLPPDDWYGRQIADIMELFYHAVNQGEAVVSFLDRPQDEERARQVSIPLHESTQPRF
jgi:hypothetical protein